LSGSFSIAPSRLSTLSAASVGRQRQHARLRGQDGDGRDVPLGIVGHLGDQQVIDHQRPDDAHAQRVAVGGSFSRRCGAGVAAGARPVFDHEGLAELVLRPSATMRARLSGVEPAMNGTTMVTCRAGHSWATSAVQ
jgi:hypothetical protein